VNTVLHKLFAKVQETTVVSVSATMFGKFNMKCKFYNSAQHVDCRAWVMFMTLQYLILQLNIAIYKC